MIDEQVVILVVVFVGLFFSMVIHEIAHAVAALVLGDDTAKRLNRITLDPLQHIDPVMTLLVPGICLLVSQGQSAFGGAKPVPVDIRRLRRPRRDMALIALAGPVSNVLLAAIFAALANVCVAWQNQPAADGFFQISVRMVQLNLTLALFNMLPIPPLDGSRVLAYFLPADLAVDDPRAQQGGMLMVMLLSLTGGASLLAKPIGRATLFLLEWTHRPFTWF